MREKGLKIFLYMVLMLFFFTGFSQSLKINKSALIENNSIKINWGKPLTVFKQGKNYRFLTFENIAYDEKKNNLPYFFLTSACKSGVKLTPIIDVVETAELTTEEELCVDKNYLTENFEVSETQTKIAEKTPYMFSKFVPLRNNKYTGKIEKLIAYQLKWQPTNEPIISNQKSASAVYASTSVLASGKWCKISTAVDGVYKIDKIFLQKMCVAMGIDVNTIDPRNIKIYGNGGEILSEKNSDFHYDDLTENAIYINGESDGVFDAADYVLFFGQSARKTKYNQGSAASMRFSSVKHYYSDSVFYFLTVDGATGKRIQPQASLSLTPNYTVTATDFIAVHEVDLINLVKSGREMYGESFENTASYSFSTNIPNLQSDTVWIKTSLAGRRVDVGGVPPGAFDINYPGGSYQITFPVTCASYDCDVAKINNGTGATNFIYSGGSNSIGISINRTFADESGWFNYYWLNARRGLVMSGNQTAFMDYRSIGSGNVSQFNLQTSLPALRIWDITDPFDVKEQASTFSSSIYSFISTTDSLKKFIAFDGVTYKTPAFSCTVEPQNLHSFGTLQPVDYIVVAHPWFLKEANDLAQLHLDKEGYRAAVVTPDQIYNEFSSGVQDITAIREFVRMLYKRATTDLPKYLLLYGDGSYLNKIRDLNSNTNFIPTFQTVNSSSWISSKCSDDFYGFLDDTEGYIDQNGNPSSASAIDIGIGRLPVSSVAEADAVLNKIIQYYNRKIPPSSCCDGVTANAEDWRNWVSLIADDANPGGLWETTFVTQSEYFASLIGLNKRYNVDKIYLDAYQVLSVPGGRRYPDVVTAINNRVSRGALIIGFSGHGGELGLTHEEAVTVNQIQGWNNINNMPLFFTATCEFSRFDDPFRTSAGEYIMLNANGGGIALFTTTRLAFASDGNALGSTFYPASVNKLSNGKYPALGDIIRQTKFVQPDYLHFALLGDPAVMLSYPKEDISTNAINMVIKVAGTDTMIPLNSAKDTISALGKYTLIGFIADTNGNKITSFNGAIYPTIYDKPVTLSTLDNGGNGTSAILSFKLQKNAIYRGKAAVINGDFQFTFIVPKDIFYNYGFGKISYYAQENNGIDDAAGAYTLVRVGGTSSTPISDIQGPGVKLFMNNNQFVVGGITNENPYIYAEINDSSGINTTGNGLGHDIVATIDANTSHAFVLNDYYQADVHPDSISVNGVLKPNKFYQTGNVKYQVSNLTEGTHHLNVKVWDILNNSSTSSTDFVVAKTAEVALAHVLNYPNPFSNATKFFVEHNQACDFLTIEVQIFTITGRAVKTLLQTVRNEGFRTEGISWDGRDDFGDKLARGVYIYKVSVKNDLGSKADKIEKLVILN